jgi:hypothetical protein
VAAANSGILLAAADFAPQVTFVGETDIATERRWNRVTAAPQKIGPVRVQPPMAQPFLTLPTHDASNPGKHPVNGCAQVHDRHGIPFSSNAEIVPFD